MVENRRQHTRQGKARRGEKGKRRKTEPKEETGANQGEGERRKTTRYTKQAGLLRIFFPDAAALRRRWESPPPVSPYGLGVPCAAGDPSGRSPGSPLCEYVSHVLGAGRFGTLQLTFAGRLSGSSAKCCVAA